VTSPFLIFAGLVGSNYTSSYTADETKLM